MPYWTGWRKIRDTCWLVETVKKNKIKKLGKLHVSGKKVGHEMDVHLSIKGYEPLDIAKKQAHKKFRGVSPLIVREIRCHRRRR